MALQKVPGKMIELASQANSDVIYFDGTEWVRLEKGAAGDILTVNENATAPQWGADCTFPGAEHGYVCGGYFGQNISTVFIGLAIEKFSLTSDGNATDVADMISSRRNQGGHSSQTHGYITGGATGWPSVTVNSIERFQFSNDSDCVDWADLLSDRHNDSAVCSSLEYGWTYGGHNNSGVETDGIERFPFASQTNSTDWADCSVSQHGAAGCNSPTHGYAVAAGRHTGIPPNVPSGTHINNIDKFPFATQTNATDIGDITVLRSGGAGVSSCDHGYMIGGTITTTNPNNGAPTWTRTEIDKFSFASDGNSTDHGDLPLETGAGASHGCGVSGLTHGYSCGGIYQFNNQGHQYPREQIEKFSYASNVIATDVGDLVDSRSITPTQWGMDGSAGCQV
ncbi:MAG: hypothetical protein CMF86_00300 [Candidatus Marinimicrobia bacterium]|nr:hypothetical protein [Candidatus Neomarinimicrobiota bacterium]